MAGEKMKKIIITTGCDYREAWESVLKLTVPRFKRYAAAHGYEFRTIWYPDISSARFPEFWQPHFFTTGAAEYERRKDCIRWVLNRNMLAPNWLRYAAIMQLLDDYDLVVYLEADLVIADFETNIAAEIPEEKWLAAPICGPSPDNAGPGGPVLITRACAQAKKFWEKVWAGRKWIDNPFWTDGVDFMDLLGYSIMPPIHKTRLTEYDSVFHALAPEWAVWLRENPDARGRAYHIAGGNADPTGKAVMIKNLIDRLSI
jgi:hypothetical protein